MKWLLFLFVFANACWADTINPDALSTLRYPEGTPVPQCTPISFRQGFCEEVANDGELFILSYYPEGCEDPKVKGYLFVDTHTKTAITINLNGAKCMEQPIPKFEKVMNEFTGRVESCIRFYIDGKLYQTFYLH